MPSRLEYDPLINDLREADNYLKSVSEDYPQLDILSNEIKNMALLNPDIPKFLANAKKCSVFIEVFNEFKNILNSHLIILEENIFLKLIKVIEICANIENLNLKNIYENLKENCEKLRKKCDECDIEFIKEKKKVEDFRQEIEQFFENWEKKLELKIMKFVQKLKDKVKNKSTNDYVKLD
uniref:Uncharacterized protein n=1 Tax=Meloidogyne floridensis TaxID=298350 RepID=A0A915P7M2_9BILA